MFRHNLIEPLVRAYERARAQEADPAHLHRRSREGRAGAGHHRDWTLVRLTARVTALRALTGVAALVAKSAVAAVLVASGYAPALG